VISILLLDITCSSGKIVCYYFNDANWGCKLYADDIKLYSTVQFSHVFMGVCIG